MRFRTRKSAAKRCASPASTAATNIVVDGNALRRRSRRRGEAISRANASAAAEEPAYVVGFADDRQETHTVSEIVALYALGKLDEDSLVWKDGMADWLSPFDVPEIAAAFRKAGVARRPATVAAFHCRAQATTNRRSSGAHRSTQTPSIREMHRSTTSISHVNRQSPLQQLRQSSPELKPAAVPVAAGAADRLRQAGSRSLTAQRKARWSHRFVRWRRRRRQRSRRLVGSGVRRRRPSTS